MTAQPPAIVPIPAVRFSRLRGHRVIVGVPGLGFRADLRADDPVVLGSRTYIPVLTEQDYYRAETEQIEAFAPLVPVERVWVERVAQVGRSSDQQAVLDAPPRQDPVPASTAPRIGGQRLVQAVADGHVRNLRAVTDVYVSDAGTYSVRICDESAWYAWALTGQTPSTVEVDALLLWVE